jgi:hypothetical protein
MKVFKTSLVFITITFLLIHLSCRKSDQQTQETVKSSLEEDRFFNAHRNGDRIENALIAFLKRNNAKEHFVEKTISRVGFPHWDKVMIKTKRQPGGRGSSGADATVYYIPFVRDSQNYVNASMAIRVSESDTTFSYLCDWQYSRMQNSPTEVKDSAEYYAIFFMQLDKLVFGRDRFKIVDPNLFRNGNHRALYVTLSDSANAGGRSNLVEVCQDVIVIYENCTFQGS